MSSNWKLTITKADNGYVCVAENGEGSRVTVFEEAEGAEGEDAELDAMESLLFFVKEYFNVFSSKHNKKNIIIKIESNTQQK